MVAPLTRKAEAACGADRRPSAGATMRFELLWPFHKARRRCFDQPASIARPPPMARMSRLLRNIAPCVSPCCVDLDRPTAFNITTARQLCPIGNPALGAGARFPFPDCGDFSRLSHGRAPRACGNWGISFPGVRGSALSVILGEIAGRSRGGECRQPPTPSFLISEYVKSPGGRPQNAAATQRPDATEPITAFFPGCAASRALRGIGIIGFSVSFHYPGLSSFNVEFFLSESRFRRLPACGDGPP